MELVSKRVKRYIALALQESTKSKFGRISIGAVIVDGNYVVSKGSNSTRTHPRQAAYNRISGRVCSGSCTHAEVQALINSKQYDLAGCEIFVGRFARTGELANCLPCPACAHGIRDAGISRCYYTTELGVKSYEC